MIQTSIIEVTKLNQFLSDLDKNKKQLITVSVFQWNLVLQVAYVSSYIVIYEDKPK